MTAKGLFITIEGCEGTGKSTQVSLLTEHLEENGIEVCKVREPGGTGVGERIREILLDREQDDMDALTELMLYEAARAQVVAEVIRPALAAGKVVVCDRFADSTTAYQGYGRGLDPVMVKGLNDAAMGGCVPDRTILLLLDPDEGLRRACGGEEGDRIEAAGRDFHHRVYDGFMAIATAEPGRVRMVPGEQDEAAVQRLVFQQLADLFPGVPSPGGAHQNA